MANQTYKYADITHQIIGAAMKVHSTLGNDFQEVIYQRALAIEMAKQGLSFQRELEMPIHYDEQQIGTKSLEYRRVIKSWGPTNGNLKSAKPA